MNKQKHIVIFSHGFGVTKTDLGLFTDIAAGLPEVESIMFDYNIVDEKANNISVQPFSKQVELLCDVIEKTRSANPLVPIDIIAHSQGCITAALVCSQEIRKTILIAPPENLNLESTLRRARSKPGTIIDLTGTSILVNSSGTKRFVPAKYWQERAEIDPITEYKKLHLVSNLTIIKSTDDEVIGETEFPGFDVISLNGGHNFKGSINRVLLIAKVREIIM